MNPTTATAIRGAAMTGAALGATLGAHLLSGHGPHVLPVAPLLWLSVVALAIPLSIARRRAARFRARGPVEILVVLLAGQAATHLLMGVAPWAFGLAGHQPGLALTVAALVAHAAAAVVLTALLCFGERLLAAAIQAARALVASVRRPRPARLPRLLACIVGAPSGRAAHRPRTSRGPPAGLLAPAGSHRH